MLQNCFKCPHCNGLISVTPPTPRGVTPERKVLLTKIKEWLDRPVTVLELLQGMGFDGNFYAHEPIDREVIRTAFRSTDVIEALKLTVTPEEFHYTVREIPGWSNATVHRRVFGISGRWWVRVGSEGNPGYMELDDDLI